MPVTVHITVDRAAAIIAGRSDFGRCAVQIDPADLPLEERETLSLAPAGQTTNGIDLTESIARNLASSAGNSYSLGHLSQAWSYPRLSEATPASVREVLQSIRIGHTQAKAEVEANRAATQRDKEARQLAWLKKPDAECFRPEYTGLGYYRTIVTDTGGISVYDKDLLPEVTARLARLQAEANRRTEEAKAEHERREAEEKAAKAAKDKQRREWLDKLAQEFTSDEQKRRAARGMLPVEELLQTYRDALFAELDRFPRYQRITDQEVRDTANEAGQEDLGDLQYSVVDLIEATAAQFAALEAIETVAKRSIPHEVTVKLRRHKAGFKDADHWLIERESVLVTVNDGVLQLSREYAV